MKSNYLRCAKCFDLEAGPTVLTSSKYSTFKVSYLMVKCFLKLQKICIRTKIDEVKLAIVIYE